MRETFEDWYDKIYPRILALTNEQSARIISLMLVKAYLKGRNEGHQ